jgi:hypothetical protein
MRIRETRDLVRTQGLMNKHNKRFRVTRQNRLHVVSTFVTTEITTNLVRVRVGCRLQSFFKLSLLRNFGNIKLDSPTPTVRPGHNSTRIAHTFRWSRKEAAPEALPLGRNSMRQKHIAQRMQARGKLQALSWFLANLLFFLFPPTMLQNRPAKQQFCTASAQTLLQHDFEPYVRAKVPSLALSVRQMMGPAMAKKCICSSAGFQQWLSFSSDYSFSGEEPQEWIDTEDESAVTMWTL